MVDCSAEAVEEADELGGRPDRVGVFGEQHCGVVERKRLKGDHCKVLCPPKVRFIGHLTESTDLCL